MDKFKSPFAVNFEITSRCNLDCSFCQTRKKSNKGELETEEVFEVIERLADAEVLRIFITGGEPLLRDDLPEIIEKTRKEKFVMNLVTNGTRANPEFCERLYEGGLRCVQVSLQGTEEIHDKITGVKGSYKKTVEGIENLMEQNIEVFLSTVVHRKNYEYIPEMLSELGDKVNHLRTLRFMAFDREGLKYQLSPKEVKELNKKIKEVAKENDIKIVDLFGGISENCVDNMNKFEGICYAGKTRMDIAYDGTVLPCESFPVDDFAVGNILNKSVKELWNSEIMKKFRNFSPNDLKGRCGRCSVKDECNSCRAMAYNITGDIHASDPTCWSVIRDKEQ